MKDSLITLQECKRIPRSKKVMQTSGLTTITSLLELVVSLSYHIKLQIEVSRVFNKKYVKHRYENYSSIFLEILT